MTTDHKQQKSISNFLKCLSEKNYAAADKYLKQTVNMKLANKMAKYKNLKFKKQ
jgi:hypothetical protein